MFWNENLYALHQQAGGTFLGRRSDGWGEEDCPPDALLLLEQFFLLLRIGTVGLIVRDLLIDFLQLFLVFLFLFEKFVQLVIRRHGRRRGQNQRRGCCRAQHGGDQAFPIPVTDTQIDISLMVRISEKPHAGQCGT